MDFRPAVLLLVLLCGGSEGLQNITAEPGKNVTLTCEAPENLTVLVAEWRRTNLSEKCLFALRQNHITEDVHRQFKNRVFLLEGAKGGGSVSVVVRNVTIEDSGTYTCQIKQTRTADKRITKPLSLFSVVRLSVVPPDVPSPGDEVKSKDGSSGHDLTVGAAAAAAAAAGVVLGFVVVCVLLRRRRNNNNNRRDDEAPGPAQTSGQEQIPLNGVQQSSSSGS